MNLQEWIFDESLGEICKSWQLLHLIMWERLDEVTCESCFYTCLLDDYSQQGIGEFFLPSFSSTVERTNRSTDTNVNPLEFASSMVTATYLSTWSKSYRCPIQLTENWWSNRWFRPKKLLMNRRASISSNATIRKKTSLIIHQSKMTDFFQINWCTT